MKSLLTAITAVMLLLPGAASAQYSASNGVLSLGGAGYISVPFTSALNNDLMIVGQVSIDAWIRPTASGNQMTIAGNDLSFGYWFGLNAQGKLRFNPNPSMFQESNATIALNTWTHVGVSYDARNNLMRFYVNGALDRTINTPQSYIGYSYFDFRIGADRTPNGPALYWTGMIDEVRVWDSMMDYSSALGLLYRVPHGMVNGLHGKHLAGGWRLNGNGVSVGGTTNGSPVGSVSFLTTPDPPHYPRMGVVFSNAVNTSDRIIVQHRPALAFTQNYTLECWVRPATGGNAQFQTFIGKGDYDKLNWQFWLGLNKSNGRVRFAPINDWNQTLESPAAIPLNTWTHVAARFEQLLTGGRVAVLFINGLEVSRRSYSTAGTAMTDHMFFGSADVRASGNTAFGYSGILDEVRIWNVPRSDDQIADHHRMELDGPLAGLLASYHFDGDDLDESGNAIHGTGAFPASSNSYFVDASSLPSEPSLTLVYPLGGERWPVGTQQRIRWSATGLPNVRIELSRDGGASYSEVLAPSVAGSSGQFDWTVTSPETFTAVVRVRPPSTQLLAQSSGNVTIETPVPLLDVSPRQLVFTANPGGPAPPPQAIHIRNVGGSTLNWTASPNQGLWLDVQPPSGASNDDSTLVQITDTQLPVGQYTDKITIGGNAANAGLQVNIVYNIVPAISYMISGAVRTPAGLGIEGVQVSIGGTESRNTLTGPKGEYSFTGLPPGDYTVVPVSLFYDFTPPTRTYAPLTTNQSGVNFEARIRNGNVVIHYDAGWNLISLPMNNTGVTSAALFPEATSAAYEYIPTSGYVEATVLEFGKGYWIKFPKRDSVVVSGTFTPDLTLTLSGEFGGWALIGTPSGPVHISSIMQTPAASLLSVYGYHPDTGYFIPSDGVMRPGHGYFVKVNADAVLKLISAVLAAPVYKPDW
jgi:hypothetical protein